MRKILPSLFFIASLVAGSSGVFADSPAPVRGLLEVSHENVKFVGGFWGPRVKIANEVTIPHALDELEKDGHVTNFDKAAGKFDGPLKGHHAFDSDLHKVLEGAFLSVKHFTEGPLRGRAEAILARVVAAQKADGFLISYFIVKDFEKRWQDMRLEHQLYNAGHFFEAAVAHQRLVGDTSSALAAAKRFADNVDATFGEKKRYDVDGHEEVELALIKLYRATGERRYLELARFFLDERGYAHGTERKPFDPKNVPPEPPIDLSLSDKEIHRAQFRAVLMRRNGRMQDHKPIIEQMEAVGHAVRAAYLYSAMADMVRFSEAPGYEKALDSIWNDVVGRKMYLTGNIGTDQNQDEGFGDPYLLPNESAYCETCAAIAHVLWQHRMNLLKADAKYADVMELALYNGVLSGVSLSGDLFCYQNPLSSAEGNKRKPWIGLSCCPTNIARIIPQVGGLMYALGKDEVFVNLYAASETNIQLNGSTPIKLTQETEYPWEGRVKLTVTTEKPVELSLNLRIPGWAIGRPVPSGLYIHFPKAACLSPTLKINGASVEIQAVKDGYVHLKRTWKAGDTIELNLPMPVEPIHPYEKVAENKGKVALMRGPIVYCVEAIEQQVPTAPNLFIDSGRGTALPHNPDILGGVTVINCRALLTNDPGSTDVSIQAIPYYAWGNRGKSPMAVWLNKYNPPAKEAAPKK